jgi:hypothetical protein
VAVMNIPGVGKMNDDAIMPGRSIVEKHHARAMTAPVTVARNSTQRS